MNKLLPLLLSLSFIRPAFADDRPGRAGLSQVGLSGNVIAPVEGSAVPAVGVRVFRIGDPLSWFDEGEASEAMARISAQGQVGGADDGSRTMWVGHAQVHAGVGRFEGDHLYYMPVAEWDFDGEAVNHEPRAIHRAMVGGELGVRAGGADRQIYVGVHSGIGGMSVADGNKPTETGSETRWYGRSGLEVGGSAMARLGKANVPGTVLFDGSGGALVGHGERFDAAVDVNVTKHLQLGAGIRYSAAEADLPGDDGVSLAQPFVRLTLTESGTPRGSYRDER